MKWDFDITFDVSHGRRRVFSLHNAIGWIRKLHHQHRDRVRSCYAKTRYPNQQSAKNAEWFKKHPKPFAVYLCDVCDGYHITTKRLEGREDESGNN